MKLIEELQRCEELVKCLSEGLNNGSLGLKAVEEDKEAVINCISGSDMVFVTCGMGGGTGYGLGVSSLLSPALSGNPGSQGIFGWGGAAMTSVFIDPKEELVGLFFTQFMPGDMNMQGRFQTLVYQAIVD